jgi:GNAT superfamily N-acetyltransferase
MLSQTLVSDAGRAIRTVVLGFSGNPVVRWLYPEPDAFLRNFPAMVQHLGGGAFASGGAYHADGFAGAAMWLPPNVYPDDERLEALLAATLTEAQLEVVGPISREMEAYYPEEPCWYLAFIAVDPPHQRRGLGSALMKHGIERCTRDGLPAYLEATSLENRAFYERHGFETLGKIQPGPAPPIWPMLRRSP